jgi:hypothetical protein
MAVFIRRLRGFHDFLGSDAARAHANPLHSAVDHRPHGLKVWFESPRADVMRVAHLPAYNRRLTANLATLCHSVHQIEKSGNSKYIERLREYQGFRATAVGTGA